MSIQLRTHVTCSLLCAEKQCTDDDYKDWSPADSPVIDCLMGRKITVERRRANAFCFNGRDYERERTVQNCSCRADDYEWFVFILA